MYKLIKHYKNLENHAINGKIKYVERLQERCVLLELSSLNLQAGNNLPIQQQYLNLKSFLGETTFDSVEFLQQFNMKRVKNGDFDDLTFPAIEDSIQLPLQSVSEGFEFNFEPFI